MNRKFVFAFAAVAAMFGSAMLTSCSSDDEIASNSPVNPVNDRISYNVGFDGKVTRGLGLSSSDLTNEGLIPNMQVWAYYAPDAQGTGVTAGAMYIGKDANTGITVTNTGGVWQEDAQYTAYWPAETATLNFQAIAPATHESITSITNDKENDLAHMVANVTIPQENAKQVDILMANTDKVTKGTSSRKVQFGFKHVLSQIRFSVKTASEQVSGEIKGISLCNIKETGTVGFHKGDDTGDAANNYAVALVQHEPADLTRNTEYPIGMIADGTFDSEYFVGKAGEGYPKVKDMTAANGSLLLLAQNTTKWATVDGTPVSIATANAAYNTYIKVYCKIKNGDTYLVGSESAFGEVYIPFAANWQMGKKYVYTINIGTGNGGFDADGNPLIMPIKYEVTSVDDWTDGTIASQPEI